MTIGDFLRYVVEQHPFGFWIFVAAALLAYAEAHGKP